MFLYREAIRIGKGVAIRLGIGDQILSPLEEMHFPQSPTNRYSMLFVVTHQAILWKSSTQSVSSVSLYDQHKNSTCAYVQTQREENKFLLTSKSEETIFLINCSMCLLTT